MELPGLGLSMMDDVCCLGKDVVQMDELMLNIDGGKGREVGIYSRRIEKLLFSVELKSEVSCFSYWSSFQ